MEPEFKEMIRASSNYKKDKESKHKEESKTRLSKIAQKKIQTTMIGALSSIEKNFGFLWSHEDSDTLTPEEEHMKELFEQTRSEILDKGNSQMRNLDTELSYYDVVWLRYNLTMPVKPREITEEETDDQE